MRTYTTTYTCDACGASGEKRREGHDQADATGPGLSVRRLELSCSGRLERKLDDVCAGCVRELLAAYDERLDTIRRVANREEEEPTP